MGAICGAGPGEAQMTEKVSEEEQAGSAERALHEVNRGLVQKRKGHPGQRIRAPHKNQSTYLPSGRGELGELRASHQVDM